MLLLAGPWTLWAGPVVIPGVPDYQQGVFPGRNDCTPVAAAVVLGYWDSHGYGNLIAGPADYAANPAGVSDLVARLKIAMNWDSSGTAVVFIPGGILSVAAERGYSFSASNDYAVSWEDVKTQVDAGQPPVFTMTNPAYQSASHSVACVGYQETGTTRIVISHDNWDTTPEDVYLNFDECGNKTLTAIAPPKVPVRTLTVRSTPIAEVPVAGSPAGITDYAVILDGSTSVDLTAPVRLSANGTYYHFVRWTLDGADLPDGQTTLPLTMDNSCTATAVYETWPIRGDANRDCRVDVIDLLFIRNRFNMDPDAGDNWQADVNGDGRINILDMFMIRPLVNTSCPN